jgi:enoyl-CoA hydratase/carnithine racemase
MPTPHLKLAIDGGVARLSIDRPERRNALDQAMWAALPDLVEQASADPSVRLLVLGSTTPGIFAAGADIHEFARASRDPDWRARNQAAIRRAQRALTHARMPVIAAIDGDCVGGGCGLALACDIRIASPRARLGITPARLGLVYPLHDTRLLVDLVGPGHARRMLYTGMLLSADEALGIGLVEEVAEDPDRAATALGDTIMSASGFSQEGSRRIVRRILEGQVDDDEESRALFDQAFTGADFAEGVAAFLGKRRPVFRA